MVTEKDLVWSHGVHLACCTSEAWAQIIFDEPWITGSVLRVNLQENHGNPDISWGKPWFLVSMFPSTNPLNGILAKPIFTHTHSLAFFLPAGLPGPPGCFFGAWNWDNLMYLSRRFALCRTGPENGAPAIPTKIDQWLSSFHRHMSSFYDHFPQLTWQKMWAL